MLLVKVLCFCYNYYGKTPRGEIIDALVGFYEDKEIEHAKETLFNVVRGLTPKIDYLPRCRLYKDGTNKRRLDSEDLISLIEFVDKKTSSYHPSMQLMCDVHPASHHRWWTLCARLIALSCYSGNLPTLGMNYQN